MINVTYQQLNAGPMVTAIGKMCAHAYPMKMAYKLVKLRRKLEQEINLGRDIYSKMRVKYAEKSEDGKVIQIPGMGIPKLNESMINEFLQEQKNLMAVEIKLDAEPLEESDLGNIELTPDELEAIQPLLVTADAIRNPA